MALTTDDRQEIRQAITDAVTSSIGPLVQHVSGLETRLYGQGQNAGDVGELRSTVGGLSKRVNRNEVLLALIIGSGGVTGGIFTAVRLFGG
uniref:Uncharacterized protein n=1 Tax=viral metagenome TaxID=1070528 RepID=A0A6M3J126_9ZZZZ